MSSGLDGKVINTIIREDGTANTISICNCSKQTTPNTVTHHSLPHNYWSCSYDGYVFQVYIYIYINYYILLFLLK